MWFFTVIYEAVAVARGCIEVPHRECNQDLHKSLARSVFIDDSKFKVGSGTTCPCVDDLCNDNPWDSILNEAVDTIKMMSTKDYMSTEGKEDGEYVTIPDGPTQEVSTNLLMTSTGASNAEDTNGPSARCVLLCGFLTLLLFRSFELIW